MGARYAELAKGELHGAIVVIPPDAPVPLTDPDIEGIGCAQQVLFLVGHLVLQIVYSCLVLFVQRSLVVASSEMEDHKSSHSAIDFASITQLHAVTC